MPVPTDTFWNIRRLNRVFAISAILMLGTFVWAVVQDYDKDWRQPQRNGKVWEAALVTQKLKRDFTPDKQAQSDAIDKQIGDLSSAVGSGNSEIKQIEDQIR